MSNELTEKPKATGKELARQTAVFADYMKTRLTAIRQVAASHMSPERLYRIVMANVTRTPALQQCTVESIFRATLQAAELGLTPGSAAGECYLVPYGQECQFIPGYRGLVALAFRSGHVKSVRARVVYQGDKFDYEDGLSITLTHKPSFDGVREPKDITYAYCVVNLKDGGLLCDVMTRGEIDAIRNRSKAARSGPWVSDFAEMAKKTVTRRCLKYAPMSVEMSKALAADESVDTGDMSMLAEFETIDVVESEPVATKTDRTRDKIPPAPEETYTGPTVSEGQETLV